MRKYRKLLSWILLIVLLGGLALVWVSGARVAQSAKGRLYTKAEDLPEQRVALVLGCSRRLADGRGNLFFSTRIQTAAALWKAGKARAFIVSGDNSRKDYDEPTDMKEALVTAGVPAEKIYCDYAGFRTLDSVVRAKAIFGQTKITVVSQCFHNERAIYLAQAHGIDAVGCCASDVRSRNEAWARLRERLARVSAVLDCTLFRTQPKYGGQPVHIQ